MPNGNNTEAIKVLQRTTNTQAGNLAGVKAVAQKRFEDVVVESRAGSVSNGVSYVTSRTRATVDQQGSIVTTGVSSHLSLQGQGMFVVADGPDGEKRLTREGQFGRDELGFWKNNGEELLMAWELDENGNIPQDSGRLSSLTAVNFASIKADPNASTAISMALNLNSEQDEIRGAGPLFKMQRSNLNATTGVTNTEDLLIPEITATGSLQLGDTFEMQSSGAGVNTKFEFGGMTVGRAPAPTSAILGAANTTGEFSGLADGATLNITVGGQDGRTFVFNYKQGSPKTSNKEFNNIQTLSAAINKITTLNSRIDTNGNIHIGTTNPNAEMSFSDTGGSDLSKQLGLYNIAAAGPDVKRFNSLSSLQSAINSVRDTASLKAKIEDGNIDITSLSATDNFTMTTTSLGKHRIRHATLGDGSEKGRATVKITAPNNGLKEGDYVRLENTGVDKLPNGVYYVTAANSRDFTVHLLTNGPNGAAPGAGAGAGTLAEGFPAAGAPISIINSPNDDAAAPTWTKITGKRADNVNQAAAVDAYVGGPPSTLEINVGAGFAALNDIVYINGGGSYRAAGGDRVSVPDGYYRVTAAAGGNITIAVQASAGAADATDATTMSVRKVATIDGAEVFGDNKVRTQVFETINVGDNFVRVNLPNNNYATDDFIAFTGLDNAGIVIDDVTILNDKKYKIINRTENYVDIEALDANLDPTAATAGAASTLHTDLPADFGINYFSRALGFFNAPLNQNESQNRNLNDTFEKQYDKDNPEKSLSSGIFGSAVESQIIQGFDSVGKKFDLQLHFGKLKDGEWAVEVSGIKQKDGTFNVTSQNGRLDGFIQGGIMRFDSNGEFIDANGVTEGIVFKTTGNNSAPINLTLDWRNELGKIKSGRVTQYAASNNFEFTQDNGQAGGFLDSVSVSEDGYIIGTFNSGETRRLYKIPVATVTNPNGLTPGDNGTYTISKDSGELRLKPAGQNGVARILSGALETSNTDTTTELLKLKQTSTEITANARASNEMLKNIDTILAETR